MAETMDPTAAAATDGVASTLLGGGALTPAQVVDRLRQNMTTRPDLMREQPQPARDVLQLMGIDRLTKAHKAAIIISALGPESAADVLKSLRESEVRAFARATANMRTVPRSVLEATIIEFLDTLSAEHLEIKSDFVKKILGTIMPPEAVDQILEDMEDSIGNPVWARLARSDVATLTKFLAREHPQTAAVVMSRIPSEKAAKVIQRLEPQFAQEVIVRLGHVAQLSPTAMEAVKGVIEAEFVSAGKLEKAKRDPDELIGSILNFVSNDVRTGLMQAIEGKDSDLAIAVQRKMFTISDVPKRLEPKAVASVIRPLDNAVLVRALIGCQKNAPETLEFILMNMSKRLAEQIREAMQNVGQVSNKEAEEAQFELVGVIKTLAERGDIKLILPESEND